MKEEWATLYEIRILDEKNFILCFKDIVSGSLIKDKFYGKEIYEILNPDTDLTQNQLVVSNICDKEQLTKLYDGYEDIHFLLEFHASIEQDFLLLVQIKDGKKEIRKIKWADFMKFEEQEEYVFFESQPVVVLNDVALCHLLREENPEELKNTLNRYKTSLGHFVNRYEEDNVNCIRVTNGYISGTEVRDDVKEYTFTRSRKEEQNKKKLSSSPLVDAGISLKGLEDYINERVLGREKEVKGIASTLIMNYTAQKDEDTETILVLGPSGSGKTATFKAAGEYLNVPFKIVDCPSLVPEGISGTKVNDVLIDLFHANDGDLERVNKSIIFFDEFDKLSEKNPDYAPAVMDEFLKFIDGTFSTFHRRFERYDIDSKGVSKCFAGVFDYALQKKKSLGFNPVIQKQEEYVRKNLTDKDHFKKEIIDRISEHIYEYEALSQEIKRKIILESKYGIYLKKKKRLQRQFHVDLEMSPSYIDALLETIEARGESMREVNSRVMQSLEIAQYELLLHPTSYKKLILTKDTIEDYTKFDLK